MKTTVAIFLRNGNNQTKVRFNQFPFRDLGSNLVLVIGAPRPLLRYVVEKGSIAVAGVSLTINAVDAATFSVAIIPHTRDETTLGDLAIGDRVNLETDILAKHVEKLLGGRQ